MIHDVSICSNFRKHCSEPECEDLCNLIGHYAVFESEVEHVLGMDNAAEAMKVVTKAFEVLQQAQKEM